MKFLLIHPHYPYVSTIAPLSLAYIASVLRDCDCQVAVLDLNAVPMKDRELTAYIREFAPEAVGFTLTTPLMNPAVKMAKAIKADLPEARIIFGGAHPTAVYQEILENHLEVDGCVVGEGEETVRKLLEHWPEAGKDFSPLKGFAARREGKVVYPGPRPLIKDIDKIPFPSWDGFPIQAYKSMKNPTISTLNLITSRGCPYRCTFCYRGNFGKSFRGRSPENVVAEIKEIKDRFGVNDFLFADDNFTLQPQRAETICDLIIENNLDISWRCTNGIRADKVTEPLLAKMKEAGCKIVAFGVESGNNEILKAMKKQETTEIFEHAFHLAEKVGLETIGFFIIGNLGENEEKIKQTIKFAKKLNPDYAQIAIFTPYPGTENYRKIMEEGKLLVKNTDDYGIYTGRALFSYKELTPEIMERMYRRAYWEFYTNPRYIIKWLKKLFQPGGLSLFWRGIKTLVKI